MRRFMRRPRMRFPRCSGKSSGSTCSGSVSLSSSVSTIASSRPFRADTRAAAGAPMRSVLLVSYTFPPQYDVSAKRAAKLCKYLPAAGWRPVVLTKHWTSNVASEDRRAYVLATHPKALDELADVTIVRTRYHTRDNALRRLHGRLGGAYATAPRSGSNEETVRVDHRPWTPAGMMRRALSLLSPTFGDFPDAFRGWVDTAVGAGVELVRRERIDAICSLCPPATAHVVAAEIARRTGVPWVPQFDDLFSFHLESEPRAPFRWYSSRAHRRWMRHASLAGAITPAMLSYVRRAFHVDGDVVMVGFDPDESPAAWPPHRDRFRLVYT